MQKFRATFLISSLFFRLVLKHVAAATGLLCKCFSRFFLSFFCKQKILRGDFLPAGFGFSKQLLFWTCTECACQCSKYRFQNFYYNFYHFHCLFFHVLLFFKVFCHTPRPMRTGENSRGCCSLRHWDLPDCLRFPNRISPFRPHS